MQLLRQRPRNLQLHNLEALLTKPLSFRPFPARLITPPSSRTCVYYIHSVHTFFIGNGEFLSLDKPKAGAALRAALRQEPPPEQISLDLTDKSESAGAILLATATPAASKTVGLILPSCATPKAFPITPPSLAHVLRQPFAQPITARKKYM